MKKRTISILLCLSLLLGIVGSSGLGAVSAAATQAEVSSANVSGWGAHNYVASDGSTDVNTELVANADGSITVSGNQVSAGLGIGVTNTTPIYLDEGGFSMEFSFDKWDTTSGDVWFGLYLSNRKTVTNETNSSPVFKGWDNDGTMEPGEQGMVLIMRPDGDGKLRFQWFYHGVTSNTDATPAANELVYAGDGCYDNITLNSGNYKNMKLDFIKHTDEGGGYGIILSDGAFTRNGGDRIESDGAISPAQRFKLLEQIFPTGTPMYVKLIAMNAQNADTALTVHKFNGEYANRANTMDSWGVHNYVTAEGSLLESTMSATDTGDITLVGNQTAGNGELGVTYARPVDMTEGFSIEFSLDEYSAHGVNGADTWVALQIKDKMTVTDGQNSNPVFHRMDIGGGDPAYGSGLHIMMRPGADHVLTIQEIYYCGLSVDASGNVVQTKSWLYNADGCYAQIKLESFEHIKVSFIPDGNGGYYITFNDGDFEPVNNPNPNPGYINLANSFSHLYQWFQNRDAYVALTYKSNQSALAKFTVHSFNGEQAAPNTENSWGIHDYVALDGSSVDTTAVADKDGNLIISGNQTAGHGAIGATWKRPVDISDGLSVEFSMDDYALNGVNGVDSWISLQLLRNEKVIDSMNPSGAYRHFEVGQPTYGDGLVMLMRLLPNNQLKIAEIYLNGAAVDGTVVSGAFNAVTNGGCYDCIQLDSFDHIKIDIVPTDSGSFNIIFNDGDYVRVGDSRWANDHGRINVAEGFSWMKQFFTDKTPGYLKMVYKSSSGTPAQFTIHEVNGMAAVPAAQDAPGIEVVDGVYELFADTKFENGFKVQNMGGAEKNDPTVGYLNYGNSSLIPSWKLAQWETKYDFRDLENDTLFMELEDGVYQYDSIDKIFTIDTNTGMLGMELNASEVYDEPRKAGEGWPHLLIEGGTKNAEAPFASQLKNANHLRLSLSARLTKFVDAMNGEAENGLHAGAFYIYLYIKGVNEAGQSEMTWFGLTIFDNRIAFTTESGAKDGGKDDASGLFIYQVPSRAFTAKDFLKNGEIYASEDSEWMNIDIDVLPYVKRALVRAQEDGFMKGVTMDTVYIDGMNMGWEMPGTFDGKMEVKGLSLRSYVGTTYTLNNGIYNIPVADVQDSTAIEVDDKLALNVPKYLVDMDGIDKSMLIIQAFKSESIDDITLDGYNAEEAYTIGAWVNGITQTGKFDENMEVVYTADSGSIKDLTFFAIGTTGNARTLDGVYDEATNTFTFAMDRASVLVIATEKPVSTDPEDPTNPGSPATGDATLPVLTGMMTIAAIGAAVLISKKKEF